MSNQCMTAGCNEHIAQHNRKVRWRKWLIETISRWSAHRRQRRLNRQTVTQLTSLDDATLKDIGLSRGDVKWAGHLPDSISSAAELDIIARRTAKPDEKK